ncbi:MAG: class I SAM-dependent methyltransferase [Acidobacteriota bacterium]
MTDTRRFDEIAAAWDADAARVKLATAVADTINREVRLAPTMDVLDFGCGTGLLSCALRPFVRSVTGADTSAGMLDVMTRKARERALDGVGVMWLRPENGYALEGDYDLIVSSMALHHVADLAALFARFRERVRPGGQVALADLDLEDGTFHPPDVTDMFHRGFDRTAFKTLLAEAGFGRLRDATAFVHQRHGREYPIFLISGVRE